MSALTRWAEDKMVDLLCFSPCRVSARCLILTEMRSSEQEVSGSLSVLKL